MNLSCNVVLDLIPLVKDHVASEDSMKLVTDHLENCESCRLEFENYTLPMQTDINDKKVVAAIKKKLLFITSALLLTGASIGMALNNSVSSGFVPVIFIVLGIALLGGLIYIFDSKGGGGVNRFFMGRAIGTIIIFALVGIYLLLKYVLHLF